MERIDKDFIRSCYKILLDREPESELAVNTLYSMAMDAECHVKFLLRHFILSNEFLDSNKDIVALIYDRMVRRRVNFQMPKVNFFCVGTSRSGTTTLSKLLDRHKNICVSPVKETNYFSTFSKEKAGEYGITDQDYLLYFYTWNGESILGDFTPNYFSSPGVAEEIYAYNNKAKILAVLRDPVDRALSDYSYLKSFHGDNSAYNFFYQAILDWSEGKVEADHWYGALKILRRGLYSSDLETYKNIFHDNMRIMIFEDINNISKSISDICSFLDVEYDEHAYCNIMSKKYNASEREPASKRLVNLLKEFYEEDILRTQDYIKRNLSAWIQSEF